MSPLATYSVTNLKVSFPHNLARPVSQSSLGRGSPPPLLAIGQESLAIETVCGQSLGVSLYLELVRLTGLIIEQIFYAVPEHSYLSSTCIYYLQ